MSSTFYALYVTWITLLASFPQFWPSLILNKKDIVHISLVFRFGGDRLDTYLRISCTTR